MPLDSIMDRRLLIISGKGGVGKTTISAALGLLASRLGKTVLICEVEGKQSLGHLFGVEQFEDKPKQLLPNLYGMSISASRALEEYFEIQFHMKRIAKPLLSSQLVYYVTHAAPGLRDILMLGKVWHEATRKREFDLIVLDTPASGHAVSMLRSPRGFLDAVSVGPLASHTKQVMDWLQDPSEVGIHLVSMAEEMPVTETIETTQMLEDRLVMNVSTIYVNMVYPPLFTDESVGAEFDAIDTGSVLREKAKASGAKLSSGAADALLKCGGFYRATERMQREHLEEISSALEHTAAIIELPFLFTSSFSTKELGQLADLIAEHQR